MSHKTYISIIIILSVLILIGIMYLIFRLKIKRNRLIKRWNSLVKLVSKKNKWSEFAVEADRLIIDTLKFKHIKGHSAGEKIVAAQHIFTNNDDVWFCHKLAAQITNDKIQIDDKDVILRLIHSCKQTLKDLDLLKDESK